MLTMLVLLNQRQVRSSRVSVCCQQTFTPVYALQHLLKLTTFSQTIKMRGRGRFEPRTR